MTHKIGTYAAAFGVPAAILRAVEIVYGYETSTGLPVQLFPARIAIWVIALIVCGLAFALSSPFKGDTRSYEEMFGKPSILRKTTAVIAGFMMILGGLCGFYCTMSQELMYNPITGAFEIATALPLLGLWTLALLSGGGFIVLVRARGQQIDKNSAIFTLFPLYWAAFDLIVTYKEASISPFVSRYALDLAVAGCLMIAFYLHAGILYGKPHLRASAIFSALAIFFSVTSLGEAVASLYNPMLYTAASADGICRILCFGAAALWLVCDFPKQAGTTQK